jgi:hypothetical protein
MYDTYKSANVIVNGKKLTLAGPNEIHTNCGPNFASAPRLRPGFTPWRPPKSETRTNNRVLRVKKSNHGTEKPVGRASAK